MAHFLLPGHQSGYVAIVGKPNAGKSTLLNALVGQKLAIVTAKPQTTRHRILGILSGERHQAVLVDTPGVLASARVALDSAMMRSVRTALTQADVLCAVVDAAAAAAAQDPAAGLEGLAITGAEGGPPLLVLLNKCDLLEADEAERVRSFFAKQPGVAAALCASAAHGDGIKQLEVSAYFEMRSAALLAQAPCSHAMMHRPRRPGWSRSCRWAPRCTRRTWRVPRTLLRCAGVVLTNASPSLRASPGV